MTRRWRWILFGLALAAIPQALWWGTRSKVDSRVAGVWIELADDDAAERATYEFRSDGRWSITTSGGQVRRFYYPHARNRWSVRGEVLSLETVFSPWPKSGSATDRSRYFLNRLKDHLFVSGKPVYDRRYRQYRIRSVSEAELVLDAERSNYSYADRSLRLTRQSR